MITSDVIKGRPCPICQLPGHVCGDDHMRRGPVDIPPRSEGNAVAPEPAELQEYVYVVNNMQTTAMLTPKMAERLGAVPVGDDPAVRNGGYSQKQNQAVYSSSDMNTGVVGEAAMKPVRPQQKGIDDEGRTRSMRSPQEQGIEDAEAPVNEDTDDAVTQDVSAKSVQPGSDAPAQRKTRTPRDK